MQGETQTNVRDDLHETILARREQAGELLEGRGGVMPEPLTREEAER